MTYFSRRTLLKAIGATTVGVGAISMPAAAHEAPLTQLILCEVDMNQSFEIENHRVQDPEVEFCGPDEDDGREGVLHVTSSGNETKDYSSSMVNVEDRLDHPLTLAEATSDDVVVSFDYFEGPNNENAAPDEVFLIVRKADAESDEKGLYAVYKTINDGNDPSSEDEACESGWMGIDVGAQMVGDGVGNRDWAAISITKDDVMSGEMVIQTAQSLRDQEDRFSNVARKFGGDAELVAVGYGKGFTTQETVSDVYYDDLIINRTTEDERHVFDFPAAIPMDVEFEGPRRGTLTATLTPQQEEVSLDLDDVQDETVKLTRYVPVAPPVEEGGSASSVSVDDGAIVAEFPASEVGGILGGERPVLVSGRFDNDTHDAFVAKASSVRERGRGNGSLSDHL